MSLKIAQLQKYKGEDWWEWAVWIDGTDSELDSVTEVTYRLHPTFPNPIRTVSDRKSKFKLETSGWGTFTIRAKVCFKSGDPVHLEHELQLLYDDGTATAA
jgi:transcription initiation factor IIF auxiliary subunit